MSETGGHDMRRGDPETSPGAAPCPVAVSAGPYHVGFVVPDIERAMRDLTRVAGTEWNAVRDGALGDWDYRIVFSRQGPLYTELIEGPPGSPWDPGEAVRCDHIGFWAGALDGCSRRLVEDGYPLDFDARPYGRPFTYHRMPALGLRIELVDISVQPEFLRTWNPAGPPMPAWDC
ncbi:VOC family protein [Nonomuraea sp. H19]|uniref:VOC family protein n=1 Tax=Nonomuraea sp. H19 TaxID=3452206 RepID=UPI003F8BB5BC